MTLDYLLVIFRWFHGYVTSEEANSRLESKPYGSYLVRLSTTSPGKPYTLSILTSRTHIDHRRISYGGKADDKYMIRIDPHTYAFNSVVELIEVCFFKKCRLEGDLNLITLNRKQRMFWDSKNLARRNRRQFRIIYKVIQTSDRKTLSFFLIACIFVFKSTNKCRTNK